MAGAEERVRGERELRTHYERFGVALDNMIQGLCLFDADQRLVVMNARFVELYDIPDHLRQPGVRAEDVRGYLLSLRGTTMGNWDSVATSPDADAQSVSPVIVQTNTHRDISVLRAPRPGGGWVCTHEDVTERRRSEERLRYLATHDVLTRLPNRIQFEELVAQKLSDCSASGGEFALLCLDLDGFKQVNDMFGHAAGDHVLTDVAARLSDLLGQNCIAARLGGDEFAVLATDLDALKTPAMAAQAVIDALCIPYAEGERQIDIGCSIGIASYPGDGDTYERLLTASDMALVHAKNVGKGGYRFYEPAMDVAARERQQLALDLKAPSGRTSSSCITSRSSTSRRTRPAGSKRSCAGRTRSSGRFRPCNSSRWRRRRGSFCRSANGCCARPVAAPSPGRSPSASRSTCRLPSSGRPICATSFARCWTKPGFCPAASNSR